MRPGLMLAAGVLAIVAATGALWMRKVSRESAVRSNSPNLIDQPRHPVTEPMWQQARAVVGQPAPPFELPDSEGNAVHLAAEVKKGPVVLVFTKDGCPCSIEAQPFFNALAAGYRDKVVFLGVIDGPRHVASKYREDFAVPYRMLLGGDGAVFKSFKAGQSVYTTLVGRDGKVVKQWPGYCKDMLTELNNMLATAVGTAPITLDVSYAPKEMSSGCVFE